MSSENSGPSPIRVQTTRTGSSLTRKQREVLTAIQRFSTVHGYMPSVRELGKELGGLAPATVQHHVTMLRRKGFLDHDGAAHGLRLAPTGVPRQAGNSDSAAIRVTDGVQEGGGSGGGRKGGPDGLDEEAWDVDIPGMQVVVPLLGTIAAGKPLEAVERSDEYVPIPAALARGSAFVLRVSGESMVDDAILDGDLVVVQACDRVEDGVVAVVLLPDGCATLKRVYAEKDGLRLQPANGTMKPMLARDARIRGRVVGLIRQYE